MNFLKIPRSLRLGYVRNKTSLKRQLKREEARKKLENNPHALQVAIDCGGGQNFNMGSKATKSLARQVSLTYGDNIKFLQPCKQHLVGMVTNGELDSLLRCQYPGLYSDSLVSSFLFFFNI